MTNRTEALTAGLRWLHETEQTDGAILQHHGMMLAADGNRTFWFIPAGDDKLPIVVVDVARVEWVDVDRWTKAPKNPLEQGELEGVAAILAELGAEVLHTWNGHPGITGSIGLKRPANSSLLAAVERYHAGCPEHPKRGVFCDCGWYQEGNALIVPPIVQATSRRYLRCPAGTCEHLEPIDPDPDFAHDALVDHAMTEHKVPRADVGYLISHARTVTR